MQRKGSAFCGSATSLEVRYTGKPVSGWGGLVAVMRYLEQRGIRQVLTRALPDGRTSPNQIPVVEMVQAILGMQRMPSAMTLTRYFGGLVRSQIEHLSEVLGQFVLRRLRAPALGAVLDLDSTVFERYGRQQRQSQRLQPTQTRASLPSSAAGDVGRSQARAARLVAQWQYRQCTRGQGVFSRDLGQAAA